MRGWGTQQCMWRVAAVVIAVLAGVITGPAASAQVPGEVDAPTMSVTPAAGLVDGTEVSVSGTGFGGAAFVLLVPCLAGAASVADCDQDLAGYPEVGADGTFVVAITVYALIQPEPGGAPVDCRIAATCEMVAFAWSAGTEAAVARVALGFDPDAPLLLPPTVTVVPSTDLVDGQVVAVTGTGFVAGGWLPVFQCAPVEPVENGCQFAGEVEAGPDGAIDLRVSLDARLTVWGGEEPVQFDCRTSTEPCALVVGGPAGLRTARHVLYFDPVGPLLPSPTIEVEPDSDLAEGATVTVRGSGFRPTEQVAVAQCRSEDSYDCDWTSMTWVGVADDGSFIAELQVYGTFDSPDGTRIDCRASPTCAIVARDYRSSTAGAPVTFGPSPPSRGRYLDPTFTDVEVTHDVVYRSTVDYRGRPVDLKLDIYEPAGDREAARPALVWMHGGWFIFGDKSNMANYARASAERGYVGISLQYRLRPEITPADLAGVVAASYDAYDDATAGVQWLQEHAHEYRIDPDAIAVGGYSAGGVLSWNLAFLPGERGPARPLIAGSVPIAGIPFADPEPGDPPIIGFHATDDSTVPVEPARDRCAEAVAIDVTCEWVEYPTGGHGIVTSRYRDIVRRSHDFLAAHVLASRGYVEVTPEIVGCTVVGTPESDRLAGTPGDDVICGMGGDDRIDGRGGTDTIYGGEGDDRLQGGRGEDVLIGGPGLDRAVGGGGHDRCVAENTAGCR
jgi:dienelactone hydrolase